MNLRTQTAEYTELIREWTEADAARQHYVDRLMTLQGPPALDDPIWEGWDKADEVAGHARDRVRSFLAVEEHSRR